MKKRQPDAIIHSTVGCLGINFHQENLSGLQFLPNHSEENIPDNTALIKQLKTELKKYFNDSTHKFTLDLHVEGTPFQMRVWDAMKKIPLGSTVSYKLLADKLKTSPRAVGNACRANPIAIIVPCHRVVAKNHLGGFAGAVDGKLMEIKKHLLQHEDALISSN